MASNVGFQNFLPERLVAGDGEQPVLGADIVLAEVVGDHGGLMLQLDCRHAPLRVGSIIKSLADVLLGTLRKSRVGERLCRESAALPDQCDEDVARRRRLPKQLGLSSRECLHNRRSGCQR